MRDRVSASDAIAEVSQAETRLTSEKSTRNISAASSYSLYLIRVGPILTGRVRLDLKTQLVLSLARGRRPRQEAWRWVVVLFRCARRLPIR